MIETATGIGIGTPAPAFPFQVIGSATRIIDIENTDRNNDAVVGINNAGQGSGVGGGVFGVTQQFGFGAAGVWGQNTSPQGTGIVGNGNGTSASILNAGSGGAFTGSGVGLYGFATTAASGTGILGVGNNVNGATMIAGSGGAFVGLTTGLFAKNTSAAANTQAIYTENFGNIVAINAWNGATAYKILGTGSVSTHVKDPTDPTGERRIVLHAPETPEIYFMDYGEGRLQGGRTHIELDPRIAANVQIDASHPMRIFIQVEEDENNRGVVVKNKTATGFDVVELGGGHSNAPFQWQLVANRADEDFGDGRVSRNADARFEEAPKPHKKTGDDAPGNGNGNDNGNGNGGGNGNGLAVGHVKKGQQ